MILIQYSEYLGTLFFLNDFSLADKIKYAEMCGCVICCLNTLITPVVCYFSGKETSEKAAYYTNECSIALEHLVSQESCMNV